MTRPERAAQIWSLLVLAARNRQTLTYDMVSKMIGVPRPGIGQFLEPIQSYCLINGLPPLTILVVQEDTGIPGVGFIAAEDIPSNQQKVFALDWTERGSPSVEEFAQAVLDRPTNGVPIL